MGLTACDKVPEYTITSKHNYANGVCKKCGFSASLWDGKSAAMGFASGTGTSADPYIIKNATELVFLAKSSQNLNYSDVYIRLDNNIDLMGNEWTPIAKFNGNFNGNGNSISSFTIRANKNYNNGLFGKVEGTVRNLKVDNVYIGIEDENTSDIRAGGIAGYLEAGLIENCAVENAKFYIKSKANISIGGIVGAVYGASMESSVVRNCYAKGVDILGHTTKKRHTCTLGGIVGTTNVTVYVAMGSAYIQNCYSTGKIEAKYKYSENWKNRGAECGGIIGYLSTGTVQTSFSACSITVDSKDGRNRVGKIAVSKEDEQIKDCYGVNGQVFVVGDKQITINDLNDKKVVSSLSVLGTVYAIKDVWNNSVWEFDDNDYPKLKMFDFDKNLCA